MEFQAPLHLSRRVTSGTWTSEVSYTCSRVRVLTALHITWLFPQCYVVGAGLARCGNKRASADGRRRRMEPVEDGDVQVIVKAGRWNYTSVGGLRRCKGQSTLTLRQKMATRHITEVDRHRRTEMRKFSRQRRRSYLANPREKSERMNQNWYNLSTTGTIYVP
jgi:hypothetical protein